MQVLDPFALRLPGGSCERYRKHEPLAILKWKSLALFSKRVGASADQNQWLMASDQRMAHSSTSVYSSSPQSALGESRMGAHILLIFGARLLLHQRHIVLEGHRLSIQALDGNRLDASCWLPDVEALLGGIHIAGDSLASQASAHIVLFSVDRQLPIGPDRARKGLPIELHEPAIRIDRLWNAQERREGRTGYTRRLVATGACLVGPLAVVVGKIRFSELRDL